MQQDNSTLNTLSIKETIESLSLANAVVPVHVSDDMLFGEPYPGYRIVTREEFNKLSRGWLNNPKARKIELSGIAPKPSERCFLPQ